MFRENTEGVYVSIGGRFKAGHRDEVAIQEEINTYKGVHRIIRHAFEYAPTHGLTKVCMADKSNAMQQGHALWQRVFKEVSAEYPGITATHQYIDAMAMFMVKDPGQYQVIVTNNLFGDILTDIGGALQGGLGMAASGNIHPGQDVDVRAGARIGAAARGKNIANPIGAILSTALLLETLGASDEAKAIEEAVADAVAEGQTTTDIGGTLGTREVGDWIARSESADTVFKLKARKADQPNCDELIHMSKARLHSRWRTNAHDAVRRRAQGCVGASISARRAARAALERPASSRSGSITSSSATCSRAASTRIYGARHVGLKAGVPIEVPALTVNRLCGSGIQAA